MINTYRYKGAVWLDLDHPTEGDINEIVSTYNIDPHVAHELLVPTNRSTIEYFDEFLFVSLRFPAFKHSRAKEEVDQEIDFVLGKNLIITSRFDNIDALYTFSKILEAGSVIDKSELSDPAQFIFFRMLQELYDGLLHELAYIENWSNEIESGIFKGKEKEMVRALSNIGRVLIDFKKSLLQHQEILESLYEYGRKADNDYFVHLAKGMLRNYEKIKTAIENQRDIISELRDTNNALLNTQQSEVAKVITVLAFIAVPLSLFVSILQIETRTRPIVGSNYDFWILIGIVLGAGALMFTFFKYKKWL